MSPQFEIQLIAVIVAVTCALPGTFLLLRKMTMMADSITHTILLGIVLVFFVVQDLSSPLLIVGAAAMGVMTVWLTEALGRTGLMSEDSSIGVVFPLLFSIAIILITRYAGRVHICTDSVLLGELAFAPFDRMMVAGIDIGAKAIYTCGIMLIINIVIILVFFKELKLVAFDAVLASALGFAPVIIHYVLMTLVSLTTVVAFEAVGSVLVIAFIAGPPATGYLLTDNLKIMLLLSCGFGALSGIIGYQLAALWDVSIAGMMAVVVGGIFFFTFIFSPQRGLVGIAIRRKKQMNDFLSNTMLLHIYNHIGEKDEHEETGIYTIKNHLSWKENQIKKTADLLIKKELLSETADTYVITESGEKSCLSLLQKLYH